jgi:hypothetical protein
MSKQQLLKKFEGRKLVIATKHKKEIVIAPILNAEFGIHCFTTENFDTDLLGTFTGEVERDNDPLETARKKCYMAMELSGCDMAIASEGSFGPHPSIGFINADDEILLFVDKKHNLEIWVRELSLITNFNGEEITSIKQLIEFSENVNFPSHGLILRKSKTDLTEIIKGISDLVTLKNSFLKLHSKYGSAYVETDMRALYNPTRMQVIENAVKKLAEKISSCCPSCQTPGFGITNAKAGLPCAQCGCPTRSTLSFEYKCKTCNCIEEKLYPHNKKEEDPMYCEFCNP